MYTGCLYILVSLSAVMAPPAVIRHLPLCDSVLLENIFTYWMPTWPPKDVTLSQLYYNSGRMRLIGGTRSAENTKYKCRILNFYPKKKEAGIKADMEFENDGVKEVMRVKEQDGRIYIPGLAVVYNVIVDRGVYAAYKCRESGDGVVPAPTVEGETPEEEKEVPVAWVAAVDEANITDIRNAVGVMELIGFKLYHRFNCSDVIPDVKDDPYYYEIL